MQCRVLGPVELAAGGRRIPLASTHQRTILAILLATPDVAVRADRLIEGVWGGRPPSGARKALHNHVARLRRTLASVPGGDPGLITTEGGGYRLEVTGHDLDVHRFEELLAQARTVGDEGRLAELLDAALALWRGEAFGELATHELVRTEAVRLEGLRTEAAADRVDALLALGRHGEVIGELERQVAVDPLRDRPHGQLMLALYRAGRQAEALRAYRRLHERLGEELGVDPSPELQRLYERILRQDPELQVARRVPPERAATGRSAVLGSRRNEAWAGESGSWTREVTRRRGSLIGREAESAGIAELLADAALVTLTGPGGVGKTRLAFEVASNLAGQFDEGVAVVELASLRDPAALDHALAGVLGILPGADALRDRLVSALQGRRLLVVDNCEHLLPALAEVVDDLLQRCPGLRVLATSREALVVHGEHRYPVQPLDAPTEAEGADPAMVAHSPAVQLFRDRAVAANPEFALTAGNAASVAETCRRLDGLPLALELAAARTASMSVADLAARLADRFGLLTAGPRGEGERHRTLAQVVDWSYELLDATEALLFDRLSVFAGGFSLEAAEHVCAGDQLEPADVARKLASLVDKSMVVRTGRGYDLLETLRLYGHDRLEERGEGDRVRTEHARFFAQFVEEAGPATRGRDGAEWVRRLLGDLDNLRAAHRWSLNIGDADVALRLSAPLGPEIAWWLGDETAIWAEQAAGMPGARGHALEPSAYGAAAAGAVFRGQLDHGKRLARRGLQAAPDADDPRRLAPLMALSILAIFQGRLDDSERLAAQILQHAQTTGDTYRAIFGHIARAMNATYRGDPSPEAARAHAAQACAEADALGNPQARAFAFYAHGEALADHYPDQALRWLEDALEVARTVPDRRTEAMALLSISSIQGRRGTPHHALKTFREAVERWQHSNDWAHQWTTLRNLAFLLTRLGEYDGAAVLIAALQTSPTAARAYGADADRMRATETALREQLGDERYDAVWRAGARMSDDEAVVYALDRIDATRAGRHPS